MIIEKNGKYYEVIERKEYWSVTQKSGAFTVEFKVSKDICQTAEDVKKYVVENETF